MVIILSSLPWSMSFQQELRRPFVPFAALPALRTWHSLLTLYGAQNNLQTLSCTCWSANLSVSLPLLEVCLNRQALNQITAQTKISKHLHMVVYILSKYLYRRFWRECPSQRWLYIYIYIQCCTSKQGMVSTYFIIYQLFTGFIDVWSFCAVVSCK